MNDRTKGGPGSPTGPSGSRSTIQLGHGSGGRMTADLIRTVILAHFANPTLAALDDSAELNIDGARIAFTTDSFVVDPIFFPGGDIGDLAVNGTVNDLAVCGALPRYLSAALIIEEGFSVSDLERIISSMQRAAQAADIQIVTGDTKVVNRGKADKLFVNTSGIGVIGRDVDLGPGRVCDGDVVLVSGPIGNHGIAVLSQREGFAFGTAVTSDTAPLTPLTQSLINSCGHNLRFMRDPTRGGVAAVLNECAAGAAVEIEIDESSIPIDPPVAAACELLGIDPLHVANEGKLIAIVDASAADIALEALRSHDIGSRACLIGKVTAAGSSGRVSMKTRLGARRIVDMPLGEQLPRIC